MVPRPGLVSLLVIARSSVQVRPPAPILTVTYGPQHFDTHGIGYDPHPGSLAFADRCHGYPLRRCVGLEPVTLCAVSTRNLTNRATGSEIARSPRSQRATLVGVTPSALASCAWVNPRTSRRPRSSLPVTGGDCTRGTEPPASPLCGIRRSGQPIPRRSPASRRGSLSRRGGLVAAWLGVRVVKSRRDAGTSGHGRTVLSGAQGPSGLPARRGRSTARAGAGWLGVRGAREAGRPAPAEEVSIDASSRIRACRRPPSTSANRRDSVRIRQSLNRPPSLRQQIWLSFLCRSMPTWSMAGPLLVRP